MGLFEDDRFLFSLLLCLHILRYRGELTRCLQAGSSTLTSSSSPREELLAFACLPEAQPACPPNPLSHFDTDAWQKVVSLSRCLPELKDLPELVQQQEQDWAALAAQPPDKVQPPPPAPPPAVPRSSPWPSPASPTSPSSGS